MRTPDPIAEKLETVTQQLQNILGLSRPEAEVNAALICRIAEAIESRPGTPPETEGDSP